MPTDIPEAVYREIAADIDPVDPEECAADRTFRAIVIAAYEAGRASVSGPAGPRLALSIPPAT